MKIKRSGLIAIAWMAAGGLGVGQLPGPAPVLAQTGHDLFQQALVKEQAEGDLRAAIQLYERIVQEFAADRGLAARALVQMGQCHERLGSQEARKAQEAYRQVLEKYADQSEPVEQARARLAALSRPPPAGEPTIQSRLLLAGLYGDEVEFNGGPTPNGRDLVYIDWESGNLASRDLTTGASRMLTDDGYDPGYPMQARVSPDGGWVAYTWAQNEPYRMELRVVGMTGPGSRTLQAPERMWAWAPSPDGRQAAFWIQENEAEIWVMENLVAALKEKEQVR